MKSKEIVCISLESDLLTNVKQLARSQKRSVSNLSEILITIGLEHFKEELINAKSTKK